MTHYVLIVLKTVTAFKVLIVGHCCKCFTIVNPIIPKQLRYIFLVKEIKYIKSKTKFPAMEILNSKSKVEAEGAWLHIDALNSSSVATLIIPHT